jgi:putative ABC transport system substrate-binding protein
LFRRALVFLNKILKGKRLAALAVERSAKFDRIVDLKTAKQIGVSIPPNVLARADQVIR